MGNIKIRVTKITSTPTIHAWSQAYSAGNFSALIALSRKKVDAKNEEKETEEKDLQAIGREVATILESEYFTVEKKTLASVKQAVITACERLPADIQANLIATTVVNNILYAYVFGGGKVFLRRGTEMGLLVEKITHAIEEENTGVKVDAVSGYLKGKDTIFLMSDAFLEHFSEKELLKQSANETPQEIAEAVMPHLHKKKEGSACAIIISATEELSPVAENEVTPSSSIPATPLPAPSLSETPPPPPATPEQPTPDTLSTPLAPSVPTQSDNPALTDLPEASKQKEEVATPLPQPSIPPQTPSADVQPETQAMLAPDLTPAGSKFAFLSKRTLLLSIAGILGCIIIGSIYMNIQKQKAQKLHAQFEASYASAQKKYDEGQSLLALNKQDARSDFMTARAILVPYTKSYPAATPEGQQITSLQQKIAAGIKTAAAENVAADKVVDAKNSPLLSAEMQNAESNYFAQDDKNIYFLGTAAVTSLDKSTQKTKVIIKNSSDWSTIGGLGTYLGNMYVLDKKSGILKYISGGGGFSKNTYFTGTVDVSHATSITIDGSVYILFSDGSIKKFTKGKPDDFTLSGLDKALKSPTRIFTTADDTNLYVLDNGNSRVVVLNKTGTYQSQYQSAIAAKAKDFDVLEKDKKIYVLNDAKMYEIDIK